MLEPISLGQGRTHCPGLAADERSVVMGRRLAMFFPDIARAVGFFRSYSREVNLDGYEDVRGRGSLGREYVLTYRNTLEPNEQLIEGTFWGARGDEVHEVSIAESLRRRFDIQIGDLMRFDILGRSVEVEVSSQHS